MSALCSEVGAAVGGGGGCVVGNGGTQAEASDAAVDAEVANALAWDILPTHQSEVRHAGEAALGKHRPDASWIGSNPCGDTPPWVLFLTQALAP